jgi:hypothetical protein
VRALQLPERSSAWTTTLEPTIKRKSSFFLRLRRRKDRHTGLFTSPTFP